jgi:hypothetical protein
LRQLRLLRFAGPWLQRREDRSGSVLDDFQALSEQRRIAVIEPDIVSGCRSGVESYCLADDECNGLPPKVAVTEKDDYIPEEFQLLYEIQQFEHSLGGKPLITMIGVKSQGGAPPPGLSEEQGHALYEERIEEKRAFRRLSTNSKVIEVKDAGHAIHLEDPDAVVNAIREVMNAALHDALLKQ